jgi:hypothetical protein
MNVELRSSEKSENVPNFSGFDDLQDSIPILGAFAINDWIIRLCQNPK